MGRLSRVRYAKASRDLGCEMPQCSMTGTMGSCWEKRGMKLPSYSGTAPWDRCSRRFDYSRDAKIVHFPLILL